MQAESHPKIKPIRRHFKVHRISGIRFVLIEDSPTERIVSALLGPTESLRKKLERLHLRTRQRLCNVLPDFYLKAVKDQPLGEMSQMIADHHTQTTILDILRLLGPPPSFGDGSIQRHDHLPRTFSENDAVKLGLLMSDLATFRTVAYLGRYEKHLSRALNTERKVRRGKRTHSQERKKQIETRDRRIRESYSTALAKNAARDTPRSKSAIQRELVRKHNLSKTTIERIIGITRRKLRTR